ncbi:DUF6624 domain-containing protein [uncultured Mucilaginibacter sp.]|uniref:DUF6624 domain-containing protein n=1 Tax=uncultured Mucilaginibacter sp. TaxID=797541 RepID=UPI0025FEB53B|nr:DUF6624 domain-containing protein [uncultured Mucilaginibacter sp.]
MKYLYICFLLLAFSAKAQQATYTALISKADSLYQAKNYKASAWAYSSAFKSNKWQGLINDRYNAACAWALANYTDSAFTNLQRVVYIGGYHNYQHITQDTDLTSLYADKRWPKLLKQVKLNEQEVEKKLNKPLVKELTGIYNDDQSYRLKLDSVGKKYGRNSKELKDLWSTIQQKDSINLSKVKAILDDHGWLGADVVGDKGNLTLFLVIQHADIKTQEKYLPMLRAAVKEGKAHPANLALLEDRVAIRQGKKQIYGSQISIDKTGKATIDPIDDEPNVNKRRAAVGLQPLEDYVKQWGIEYHLPAN